MWTEKQKSGKVKFTERYTDPLTGEEKKVSTTLDRDTAKTRKLALQILNEKIDKKLAHACITPKQKNLRLSDLVELYREHQEKTVKPSTYRRNFYSENKLMDILGAKTLLTALNARYINQRLFSQGAAPETVNEQITRLKALLNWGYKNDYIEDIRFLDKVEKVKIEEPDELSDEEIKLMFLEDYELRELIDVMDVKRWQLLTQFLSLSGLRVDEAIALHMDLVDLNNSIIKVRNTFDPNIKTELTAKTGYSRRDVFIQSELAPVCREIRAETIRGRLKYGYDTDLFMCGINGEHLIYSSYQQYLKRKGLEVLGREITPHMLRHTHTSLLAAAGVPLETISRRLGHSDSRITKRIYLHITKRMKDADKERLQDVKIL